VFVPFPVPSTIRTEAVAPRLERPNSEDKPISPVWLVEQNSSFEIYSNGLRVEKEFAIMNRPRGSYAVFRRDEPGITGSSEEASGWRSEPAGIVFHSTESHQAPFEPNETRKLRRVGRNLLELVRQKRAYHYLIDRFGRVYRIVEESDAANHAGRSVWADGQGTYVHLNDSFLGVAFEAQTETAENGAAEPIRSSQVYSGRVLIEMLRAKYHISATNCVTHAQVSINPSNHRIGYHRDWLSSFPFSGMALPDNYRLALTSVTAFGFEYDNTDAAGQRQWPGLAASLDRVRERAVAEGSPLGEYRRRLQQRFQRILNSAAMRERGEEQ